MSFWGFLQALAGNERLDTLWPGGSNYIGAQLVMMTPLAVAKVMDSRAKGRLIFFACVISIVICTFATQSRGAFLGLSAAIAVFILSAKYRIRMFVVIGLMVLIAYPWVLEPYYKRISTVFESSSTLKQDPAVEARLILWKMAVRMWQDHPIAGIGLDNFSDVRLKYRPIFDHLIGQEEAREIVFTTEQRFPHGMYTGMLAETGTVGMVLLAILFLRNALMRFPTSRGDRDGPDISLLARGAQAGLIGFAVAATFGDYQYLETLYFQLFFVEAIKGCVQARAFVAAAEPAKPVLALNPA
jgi:O-antigen ligase